MQLFLSNLDQWIMNFSSVNEDSSSKMDGDVSQQYFVLDCLIQFLADDS